MTLHNLLLRCICVAEGLLMLGPGASTILVGAAEISALMFQKQTASVGLGYDLGKSWVRPWEVRVVTVLLQILVLAS
jgi:hypothetical protein